VRAADPPLSHTENVVDRRHLREEAGGGLDDGDGEEGAGALAKAHAEVDGLIRQFAKGWTLERMPVIDRTLLRMAVFELLHRDDVPTGVVISEAVELAKSYSTDDSSRFVNGLLAAIADEIRPGTQHTTG
jgi:transcription antitermination factor NusB